MFGHFWTLYIKALTANFKLIFHKQQLSKSFHVLKSSSESMNVTCLSRPYRFKFLKAVFHKFYLVHSWIPWLIWAQFFSILSITDFIFVKGILLQWFWNDSWNSLSFYDTEDRSVDALHAHNQHKVMMAKSSTGYTSFV